MNQSAAQIEVTCPSNGEVIGSVSISSATDVEAAVARARVAQVEWSGRSLAERCKALRKVKDRIIARTDDICDLLSKEQGKPKVEGLTTEIVGLVDLIQYFTGEAERILAPQPIPLHLMKHRASYLHWVPRGVVGIIGPWNFPFNLNNGPAIAALIAGNAVVIKPSEFTPLIQDLSREIFIEAGIPEDLYQVVHGYGETGSALIEHVDMIEFTGSVRTGRKVAAACGERLIPCVTELGGKAPFLVLEDADLERAANALAWGGFANCGQVCASVERVLVHKSALPGLLDRLVPKVKAIEPKDTTKDPLAQMGPLNNRRQRDIVDALVQDALDKGATALVGGYPIEGPGHFYAPTLLVDMTPEMRIMSEETFGPVLPIMVLEDEAAMIVEANRSHLGLLAYVFSKSSKRARRVAERIQAGTVMVNDVLSTHGMPETPWGGVKQSGVGHTHGDASLRGMCEQRHINYDLLPTLKSEPYWYPYNPKLYGMMKRLMGTLFGNSMAQRLRSMLGG
jgi:acyl-CoA reductase-like NAD-dependent aldehyde dehydrogenase